jgi:hypothetical protein
MEILAPEGEETNGVYVEFSEEDIADAQSLMSLHCISPPARSCKKMVISEPV